MEVRNEELVLEHLPLADRMACAARRYLGVSVNTCDMQGAALDGLIDAAQKFNPALGPFGPYARLRIRGEIIERLRREARFAAHTQSEDLYEMHGLGFVVRDAMDTLTVQERSAVVGLYFEGRNQAETAAKMGRAYCRVWQLKSSALRRMRAYFADRGVTRLDQVL